MKLLQVGNALSQLLNTFLGGWSDESTSSRSWRMRKTSRRWHWLRFAIDSVFGADHCRKAYLSELERAQFPPELRDGKDDSVA